MVIIDIIDISWNYQKASALLHLSPPFSPQLSLITLLCVQSPTVSLSLTDNESSLQGSLTGQLQEGALEAQSSSHRQQRLLRWVAVPIRPARCPTHRFRPPGHGLRDLRRRVSHIRGKAPRHSQHPHSESLRVNEPQLPQLAQLARTAALAHLCGRQQDEEGAGAEVARVGLQE